jgi:tetratricopeptide (TPR) repeat protein
MLTSTRATVGAVLMVVALACSPGDPLEEIRGLHAEGQFSESVDRLRTILDADPTNAEASLLLGRALSRTDNSGLAVWPLRKAAETPAYAVEAGLLLAEAMLASRTAPDALKEIDRVLALEPDNAQAWLLRVEANQTSAQFDEALEDVDRVLDLDPDNLPVLIARVTLLLALQRVEEAGTALDAARTAFDSSDEPVAQPMLARLCMARALFTFQQGETEAAETRYDDCIEQYPTERIAVSEAVAYYDRTGRSERATEVLEIAAQKSKTGAFRTILARRLAAGGKTDEAERLLREEVDERPSQLSWFVLADFYVQFDRFEPALQAFEQAMAVDPRATRLRFAYADTLVRAEQFDKAREVASRLEHRELFNLIRGRILLGEGNARGALAAFEAGIRLWPDNAVGRFLAGQAAERVGDFTRALSHYRESFRTSPTDSEAGKALAELYALQGTEEGAIQIAARYVQARSADPEAYLVSIRLAHEMKRRQIVVEGLQRLSQLPGQAAIAVAEEASLLASNGHAEKAVQLIEESTLDLTDASNAIALRVLVDQLGGLGQHDKAVRSVDDAIAAEPDEPAFHELLGVALARAGRVEPARTSFENAIGLDEQDWRALAGLASLASESDDIAEVLALYDRAIAAKPDEPGPALAAIALIRDADPEDAIRRLEAVLDAHPRTASAANDLAGLLADRGELDRAASLASRAAWFQLPEADATLARIEALRPGGSEGADSAASGERSD